MKVSDLPSKAPKILLWGDIGCGKTALVQTLGARLHLIDIDDGAQTGQRLADKFHQDRLAVDIGGPFIEPQPHLKATIFQNIKKHVMSVSDSIAAKKWPYQAVGLDSLSSLAEAALAQIMYNSGKLHAQPEIQHWGLAFTEIKSVVSILRTLPVPVVLIAHEQVKTIGSGVQKTEKLEIAISGKNMATQIGRYFDEIWYMRPVPAGGGKHNYLIQTVSDGTIPARSRASLPNNTDTSCGMVELIRRVGYEFPKGGA